MENKQIWIAIVIFIILILVFYGAKERLLGKRKSKKKSSKESKNQAKKLYDKIHEDMVQGMDEEDFNKATKGKLDPLAFIKLSEIYEDVRDGGKDPKKVVKVKHYQEVLDKIEDD